MIVTFKDYAPPQRYDGLPFTTARIEESALAKGPWTTVEVKTLSPVDTDPREPIERDFTTELATKQDGWYRIVFVDATADESLPTEPIQYRSKEPYATESDCRPDLAEIAALLRARTKGQATFTTTTKPTAVQAEVIITMAVNSVFGRVNARIPLNRAEFAEHVVALEACRMIEQSYYPEQINTEFSTFDALTTMFNPAVLELINACRYPLVTALA